MLSQEHVVTFYAGDAELAQTASEFLLGAISRGGAGVVVATAAHRQQIDALLTREGIDPVAARAGGSYVVLDAAQTLDKFLVNGWPDPAAFWNTISPVLKRAGRRRRPVSVFGEMVSLLWEAGRFSAAIDLEALWNELGRQQRFSLLCAYPDRPAGASPDDELALVLGEHDRVTG